MIAAIIALMPPPLAPLNLNHTKSDSSADVTHTTAQNKKTPAAAGAFRSAAKRLGSVLCDHRAAELVVQARGEEIDILLDAVGACGHAGRGDEVDSLPVHEHVVVLDADRPVRREAVFETGANHATPAGLAAGRSTQRAGRGRKNVVLGVGHSGTALR